MKAHFLGCICASALFLIYGRPYAEPSLAESQTFFERGINLSGGELNPQRKPAIYGKDYIYPPLSELDYFAGKGFAVVRLLYRWERLQPTLFGNLDKAELRRIKRVVLAAHARNMRVILTPTNFGRYFINGEQVLIGTTRVPIESFADFSHKVAAAFAGDPAVYALSLMNEPHDSNGLWKQAAQAGLDAIRTADRDRVVLAPGDEWSGAWRWRRSNEDFVLNDPADRVIYEAHQYFDLNHSGFYELSYELNNVSVDSGVEMVRPFAEWLKQHHLRGIITEIGVPGADPRWRALAERVLAFLACENIPWTYWAAGPWWGKYALSAEPKNGVDAPIMSVLIKNYSLSCKGRSQR